MHARGIALSICLGLIFVFGISWALRPEKDWVGFGSPEAPLSLHDVETKLLNSKTQQGLAPAGLNVPIAWFRTPEGRVIRVTLREMAFESGRIRGLQIPNEQKAAVVSSVDQRVYVSAGSSGPILQGCGLTEIEGRAILPGSTDVSPCQGPYGKLGIDSVINVAIVTFSNDQLDIPPCFSKLYEQEGEQGYQKCTRDQLRRGLNDILVEKSTANRPFDLLIMPEVATGHGGLTKQQFYSELFEALDGKLTDAVARKALPTEIVLQVWGRDRPGAFLQTIDGIRRTVETPVQQFSKLDRPVRSLEWLRLAGIAGGLSLAIAGLITSERLRSAFPALQSLTFAPTITNLLAWILICFGLADSLYKLIGPVPAHLQAAVQLALGVLIVPLAAPLIRAVKSVQDSFSGGASGNVPT